MSSTSSRNTPGNYQLEQKLFNDYFNLVTYENGAQGGSVSRNLAGDGLLAGKIFTRDLAVNYTDIESSLFGIGSTNLVQPLPQVIPNVNNIPSLNIRSKIPVLVPSPLIISDGQRANYRN
jgi:hypothetical protein